MKIFTTQLTELDLSAAEMLGKVIQIPVDLYRSQLTDDVKRRRVQLIEAALEEYDPKQDAILLIGDPVNIGLVFHLAACRALANQCEKVLTLRYDRQRETYVYVEVIL